jgi:DNA-binding Xre family transcriptional regulator
MVKEDRRRLGEDIKTVEFGWPIGMPSCRPMSDGAHEKESRMRRKTANALIDHSGSTLDSFLEEGGLLEEVEAVAIKRVIAWQLIETMKEKGITKKAMAAQMKTSRSQLDRLLDAENAAVPLETITRAAKVIGKEIRLQMVDAA